MSKTEHLVPTAQAAKILGVDRRTVLRMVARKKLIPALKFEGDTGAYVFSRADVERLAADKDAAA